MKRKVRQTKGSEQGTEVSAKWCRVKKQNSYQQFGEVSNGEALYSDFWQGLAQSSDPSHPSIIQTLPIFFLLLFCVYFCWTHKTFHLHLQTRLNNGLKPGLSLKTQLSSTPPLPPPTLLSLKSDLWSPASKSLRLPTPPPPSQSAPLVNPGPRNQLCFPKRTQEWGGPALIRCSTLSFRPSWCGRPLHWWWPCLRLPRRQLLWLHV